MTTRITRDGLARFCQDPGSAVAYLGRPLASYLLSPAARDAAGVRPPVPPVRPGTGLGLFVLGPHRAGGQPFGVLAPAFALPVEWVRGGDDSTRLPPGLAATASIVRKVTGYKDFGLSLAGELGEVDLSGLVVAASSTWAPLAAALELAVLGGRPDPGVLATGAWDAGVGAVGDIGPKVSAASVFRSRDGVPALFVPQANEAEARAAAAGKVDVHAYPALKRDWRRALSEHLLRLDVPPARGASSVEERLDYANRPHVVWAVKARRTYYLDHLVEDLAAGIARRPGRPLVDRLVLALSHSYELPVVSVGALRPRAALFLHTRETSDLLPAVLARLPPAVVAEGRAFSPDLAEECRNAVAAWLLAGGNGASGAVEVTGGTKLVTLVLASAARLAGARVLYLEHDMVAGTHAARFGTERLRVLDWL